MGKKSVRIRNSPLITRVNANVDDDVDDDDDDDDDDMDP